MSTDAAKNKTMALMQQQMNTAEKQKDSQTGPPGSSVYGTSQARLLEGVAIFYSSICFCDFACLRQ